MIEGFFFEAMTGLAQARSVPYHATLDAYRSRISEGLVRYREWNPRTLTFYRSI